MIGSIEEYLTFTAKTQSQLAKELGASKQLVHTWIRGGVCVDFDASGKLHRIFTRRTERQLWPK